MTAKSSLEQDSADLSAGKLYADRMLAVERSFAASVAGLDAGAVAIAARADAVDQLVKTLWAELRVSGPSAQPRGPAAVALLAVGGYGRGELFPHSDIDLLFLVEGKSVGAAAREFIRTMNQALWDAGVRVSPMTRTLAECERFDPENVEFTLSLLDARTLASEGNLAERLLESFDSRLIPRERKKIVARLLEVTRARHAKYGDTLFHLEPNIKDCPGGLRDANVCAWLARLLTAPESAAPEFSEARQFLQLTRTFLQLRHRRDDNTLDWHSQDQAAHVALGIASAPPGGVSPGYWMRIYFRQARSIERRTRQFLDDAAGVQSAATKSLPFAGPQRLRGAAPQTGFDLRQGQIVLAPVSAGRDVAADPDVALAVFSAMARSGARLARESEQRLEDGLPLLSVHLEDGPALWRILSEILTTPFAGRALRSMHAVGVLELVLPEFHGIDALVVRDAYHRYTVDEHTFVLIDVLNGLGTTEAEGKAAGRTAARQRPGNHGWTGRFAALLRDLPHPALLYMAAVLHDTGKGRAGGAHAEESARLAAGVLKRLEVDPYESGLVLNLIRTHLEMSAAMRRDVFDRETISALAAQVASPEALRMLTLFTYADICAVHPDAMTPWKAENLWHLYLATASYLDRTVDDERVADDGSAASSETYHRIHALLPGREPAVRRFLDGFPTRYLSTRSPEAVASHFNLALRLGSPGAIELDLQHAPEMSALTLVTRDRPGLFAAVAGALAGWGMNIVTADAFSNSEGIVVDSFRFTDSFKTLELNQEERLRFVESMRGAIAGTVDVQRLLAARRRARRGAVKVIVPTQLNFDQAASAHSTVLEVVAQDTAGLLYALAVTFAEQRCNIEVALVDTEGEMAIDVFYLTRDGARLDGAAVKELGAALSRIIDSRLGHGSREEAESLGA